MKPTLKKFFNQIDRYKKVLSDKYDCDFPLYRGHARTSWPLTPSLLRPTKHFTEDELFILEASLFQDFISQSGSYLKTTNTWETLFLMRHHGMPTRLLDWTENLFVALYFAVLDFPAQVTNPCIWILDPYRLNALSKSTDGYVINPELELDDYFNLFCKYSPDKTSIVTPKAPITIYPFRKNDRIIAQSGLFTIHGTNRASIENQCPEVLQKVLIPKEIIPEIENILDLAGFNKFSIYRDLDSLALTLKEFHQI